MGSYRCEVMGGPPPWVLTAASRSVLRHAFSGGRKKPESPHPRRGLPKLQNIVY